jgi:hypothetical protein
LNSGIKVRQFKEEWTKIGWNLWIRGGQCRIFVDSLSLPQPGQGLAPPLPHPAPENPNGNASPFFPIGNSR